jgi:hypothetical protein
VGVSPHPIHQIRRIPRSYEAGLLTCALARCEIYQITEDQRHVEGHQEDRRGGWLGWVAVHVVVRSQEAMVESLFSVELRSGQIFSLDCCRTVGPWLAGDPERSVHLWFVPSRMEWGAQKAAHDIVVSLKIAVGRRPWTSHDFLRQRADVEASKDWCKLFKDPS